MTAVTSCYRKLTIKAWAGGRGPLTGRNARAVVRGRRPGRITSLVAIGEPAVALPGATVRMPLSLLTVPVLGEGVLRTPAPRPVYRRLLGHGLSAADAAAAPDELLDVLRLAARRKGNAGLSPRSYMPSMASAASGQTAY